MRAGLHGWRGCPEPGRPRDRRRGARIERALEPIIDDLFKQARLDGRHEPREAYAFDALVILADRLSKIWIIHHIRPGYWLPVIPGVFRLSHVLNTGAAFSLLS